MKILYPIEVADLIKFNSAEWPSGMLETAFKSEATRMGYTELGSDLWMDNGSIVTTAQELGTTAAVDNSAFATAVADSAGTALTGGTEMGNAMVVADITTDATAGTVTSVAPAAAAGTVAGSVAAGAVAVGLGVLCGVGLYESNPGFWTNLSADIADKTPWKWDDIPMAERYNSSGNLTTYIPADFANALLANLKNAGALSFNTYVDGTGTTGIKYYGYENTTFFGSWTNTMGIQGKTQITIHVGGDCVLSFFYTTNATTFAGYPYYLQPWVTSKKSGETIYWYADSNNPVYEYWCSTNKSDMPSGVPYGTEDTKVRCSYVISSAPITISNKYTLLNDGTTVPYNAWITAMRSGTEVTEGGVAGITKTTDSSLPSGDTIEASYPDWWSNKFTVKGITGKSTDFLPFALPINNPLENGNTGTQAAAQTGTVPDVHYPTDDDTVEQIKKYITDNIPTLPVNPVAPSSSTPSTVVPVGSAKAMWAIYNPTQTQVESLGAWLWSSNFVDQLIKMFNSPAEAIITLHKIFITPTTGDSADIKVGYLDSGVSSLTVTKQYESYDCGTVSLKEYFGNCEDYGRFTGVQLYLPFIGFVKLSTNDVMASTINVTYRVDNYTGACLAVVTVTKNSGALVLYQYGGNMAVHYPLSAGSFASVLTSLIGTAAGVAGTIATGGALAPVLMGGGMSLLNSRASVNVSGGFNANTGAMGAKTPYLVITRPRLYNADNYNNYYGYPDNLTVTLSSCTGFTRVKNVFTTVSKATDAEKTEIESILKEGVLL